MLTINVLHLSTSRGGAYPHPTATSVISSGQAAKNAKPGNGIAFRQKLINPCRDARAAPYVSFWCRFASKQASASLHRKETASVPQACIMAWKTRKNNCRRDFYSVNVKSRWGLKSVTCSPSLKTVIFYSANVKPRPTRPPAPPPPPHLPPPPPGLVVAEMYLVRCR